MTEVKGDFPDHIISLLGLVMDGFRRDMHARLTSRGAPAATRGLRASHIRMLSLMPADGMRVTDLAERVGMTKQALGEFANTLESRGLVESLSDPADRRVRILKPTRSGRAAVVAAEKVISAIEAEWQERLGHRKWESLRGILTTLHNDAEERRTSAL
jgi:DNA-binding MarR family transcriptional regulator